MICNRCGENRTTFGHIGYCDPCYTAHREHQRELQIEAQASREAQAARIVHPAGKAPRYRARDLWIQKRDPESGRDTA